MIHEAKFLQIIKKHSKVNLLGVDMGFRYIGLASANDIFGDYNIVPECTLDLRTDDLFRGLSKHTGNKHGIVIGYSTRTEELNNFTLRKFKPIQSFLNLPITLANEEFSTQKAHEILYSINPTYPHNKFLLDQTAACIILKNFIKKLKSSMLKPLNY